MTGRRRDLLPANSGGTKPPQHHRNQQSQHSTGNRLEPAHKDGGSNVTSHDGRRVESPVNDRNFNSGNKLRTAAQHRDEPRKSAKHSRRPESRTPVHGKKTQRAIPELDVGYEKPHPHVQNSKLPRAIHKPSTLAAIERRHSYTAGEDVEYTPHQIERMVIDEITNMKGKINVLMENLSQCSHGIEMIQKEQNDIFHKYETYLNRRTPDFKSKKNQKESVRFPALSQKTSLVGNGAKHGEHEETDTSPISNIKKIARRRSNELAQRETETGNDADESRDRPTVRQTSNEELRKSARLIARDAVRRAAAQHFRKREKSATQPSEIQDMLKQETIHNSDSKIAQMLRAHDTMAKNGKVSKGQKK